MSNIAQLVEKFEQDLHNAISKLPVIGAEHMGLDARAGSRLMVDFDERKIYVEAHNLRRLDYYGGFEYVREGAGRTTLPGYVEFDGYDDERVSNCFEHYSENSVAN